jgi:hypothetical protein
MPTFEGYPQYDLGGAVPGTPIPGRATAAPVVGGVVPASYPDYPTTPYPVAPAYGALPAGTSTTSTSTIGPLPQYGQRHIPSHADVRR